jgi:hypothetical protein
MEGIYQIQMGITGDIIILEIFIIGGMEDEDD